MGAVGTHCSVHTGLCPASSQRGFSRRAKVPNLPCTLPSCQHHQRPGGIILPGSVPCSREMKPCHHPLSDSKFCINWLIKCRADFLSRPALPPQHSKAGLVGTDSFGATGSPAAAWDGLGRKPPAHSEHWLGWGLCRAVFCPGRVRAQMVGVRDLGIFVRGDCCGKPQQGV